MSLPLNKYYVTFGQQYRRERHPTHESIHPDGWVTLLAEDYHKARELAFKHFGLNWSMLYDKEPEKQYFPLGEIIEIEP